MKMFGKKSVCDQDYTWIKIDSYNTYENNVTSGGGGISMTFIGGKRDNLFINKIFMDMGGKNENSPVSKIWF